MREKERSRSDARGELRSSQRINPGSREPLDTSTNPVDLQGPALGVEGARERSGAVRAECRRGVFTGTASSAGQAIRAQPRACCPGDGCKQHGCLLARAAAQIMWERSCPQRGAGARSGAADGALRQQRCLKVVGCSDLPSPALNGGRTVAKQAV